MTNTCSNVILLSFKTHLHDLYDWTEKHCKCELSLKSYSMQFARLPLWPIDEVVRDKRNFSFFTFLFLVFVQMWEWAGAKHIYRITLVFCKLIGEKFYHSFFNLSDGVTIHLTMSIGLSKLWALKWGYHISFYMRTLKMVPLCSHFSSSSVSVMLTKHRLPRTGGFLLGAYCKSPLIKLGRSSAEA